MLRPTPGVWELLSPGTAVPKSTKTSDLPEVLVRIGVGGKRFQALLLGGSEGRYSQWSLLSWAQEEQCHLGHLCSRYAVACVGLRFNPRGLPAGRSTVLCSQLLLRGGVHDE